MVGEVFLLFNGTVKSRHGDFCYKGIRSFGIKFLHFPVIFFSDPGFGL